MAKVLICEIQKESRFLRKNENVQVPRASTLDKASDLLFSSVLRCHIWILDSLRHLCGRSKIVIYHSCFDSVT